MFRNRKAQAVLELAILGSLLILAFSLAITEGERFNRRQSYMHQTFRGALKKANKDNRPTTWSTMDFRRSSNMINPMELGSMQQFQDSNSILWSDGKKDKATNDYPKAKSWYQFNRDHLYDVTQTGPGPVNTGGVLRFVVTTSPESTTIFDKDEFDGQIHTSKTMSADDHVHAETPTASDDADLSAGGFYRGGGGIGRSKEMR